MAFKALRTSKDLRDSTGVFARDVTNMGNKAGTDMAENSFMISKHARKKMGGD